MNKKAFDADIIVVGCGMVGGLVATALSCPEAHGLSPQSTPLKIVVIDTASPRAFEPGTDPAYDLRVSALSIASRRMLDSVNAWQGIQSRRVCPYRDLSVWDGEANGRTDFHAADVGAAELGYIVENRVLQLSLWDRLQELPNVECYSPAALDSIQQDEQGVEVKLKESSQAVLRARLVIGADGAQSLVRQQTGISITAHRYEQHALVANVTTSKPQQQITWQRFVPTGPQAMLPLCGSRASVVWYHTEQEVTRLNALPDMDFINELCASFPDELGGIKSVEARASFPFSKAHADSYLGNRVALVGDAAHTVHPLAGQGVNLGLLDAAALAEVLLKAFAAERDVGAPQVLARYERWRRSNNALMIQSLDAIHKTFTPQPVWFQQLRSAGLNTVNRIGPLKNRLMQHAMGTEGDLPHMARQ